MPFNQPTTTTQHFSPRLIITLGVLFALSCIIFSATLATHTRWLGVNFVPHEKGLMVSQVYPNGPAHDQLQKGDVVSSIIQQDGTAFAFTAMDIMEDPYDLQLYQEFDQFFNRQTSIYNLLQQTATQFMLADGQRVTIQTAKSRPLSSLPFLFWFQLGCGFISLLIGAGVFAFRQEEIAPRCLAISAIGLMLIISAAAMYSTRELAIDGGLFYQLTLLNQYGTVLFVGLGTAVLWYSPRRISPLPMATILLALYSLFALLHTIEVWDSLNIGIRFPIFFFVILIIIFSILAWQRTRGQPDNRAALKWLLYTWFTGIVLFLGLRLVPVTLGFGSLIPQAAAWLVLVLIYVGITLGITRYRLFNLDRWVLRAWFWFFGGLAVVAVDIGLISLLDIDSPLATAISIALISWIYFPIRQILWARFSPGLHRTDFENLLPEILEITLSPGQDKELFKQWQNMLQRVYEPIEIKTLNTELSAPIKEAQLINNGISLRLPSLPGGSALELSGAEHADRLFNPNDARFASAVWGLFDHAVQFRLAMEQGAHEERQRIARDLHDDVAARLLTLIHRADNSGYEKLARQALTALRDTIYTLGAQTPPPLENLLYDIHHEIQQRLETIDIQLDWSLNGNVQNITLNARQHINVQRILQELVSNVIHHSHANKITIQIFVEKNAFRFNVCNNGIYGKTGDWTPGKGLNNIKNRVEELNGTADWQKSGPQGCCAFIQFPL